MLCLLSIPSKHNFTKPVGDRNVKLLGIKNIILLF